MVGERLESDEAGGQTILRVRERSAKEAGR